MERKRMSKSRRYPKRGREWGAQKLTEENLKVAQAEFSTLS
jgi:hypothetical protein